MADSFNKKDREKKRKKRREDKKDKKAERKAAGIVEPEFMYLDEFGNLTTEKPDPDRKSNVVAEQIEVSIPKKSDADKTDFTKNGVVKFFNNEKGYGFINDQTSGESYFVHIDGCIDKIKDNDKVNFEVGKGPKGPMATKVKLL